MKLISLTLRNFQGIVDLHLDFEGRGAAVYGDNATGKTTVLNSICWLLFDRPGTGAKNFTPKTCGPEGELHHLEHGVEGRFIRADGSILTLKKVLKEVYKCQRGTAESVFSGHTVEYFIDDIPVKEKEYNDLLCEIYGDLERIRILMLPHFFSEELPWEERRRILLEIYGDVSYVEVIDANPELKELHTYLAVPGAKGRRYSIEEYLQLAAARKNKINKLLQEIPGRIDEAKRAIPSGKGNYFDEHIYNTSVSEKKALEDRRRELMENDGRAAEIRRQISVKKMSLIEAKAEYQQREIEQNREEYERERELETKWRGLQKEEASIENILQEKQGRLEALKKRMRALLGTYEQVHGERWNPREGVCPTCLRPLPAEKIEALKAQFLERKSARLEELSREKERYEEEIAVVTAKIEAGRREDRLSDIRAEQMKIEQLLQKLREKKKVHPRFEETEICREITAQIAKLQHEKTDAERAIDERAGELDRRISELDQKIEQELENRAREEFVLAQSQRVSALESEEKGLARQFDEIQRGCYLCDQFLRTKVAMLTERINRQFQMVRFRLFTQQINGALREDCEAMVLCEGRYVPYGYANNAARINAGMEIIETLARHWHMTAPIFVDNAESVTRLRESDAQIVRLVVADGPLRLVRNEK